MIGTTIRSNGYKVVIKSSYGRWLVGYNGTIKWCLIDKNTNEMITDNTDRKVIERAANNRLIKDQDSTRS